MKKTYIIPLTSVTLLGSAEPLLGASLNAGGVNITYGGQSTGSMSSDVKQNAYNVWDDDWSE